MGGLIAANSCGPVLPPALIQHGPDPSLCVVDAEVASLGAIGGREGAPSPLPLVHEGGLDGLCAAACQAEGSALLLEDKVQKDVRRLLERADEMDLLAHEGARRSPHPHAFDLSQIVRLC